MMLRDGLVGKPNGRGGPGFEKRRKRVDATALSKADLQRLDTSVVWLCCAVLCCAACDGVVSICGLTLEFIRGRKRAEPAVARRVQRRVRPRAKGGCDRFE